MGLNPTFQAGAVQNISNDIPPGEWYIAQRDPSNADPARRFIPMYFDAWLRLQHNTSLTITEHPVETGVAIADHAFSDFKRFSFDIGMSNVLQSVFANTATANDDRSVQKYRDLVRLQNQKTFVELYSKYNTYSNILIQRVDVADDYTTKNAMKATIQLVQIIVASTSSSQLSADPQTTNQTNRGQVSAQPFDGTGQFRGRGSTRSF